MLLMVQGQIICKVTHWRWTLTVAVMLTVFPLCDGDYTLRAPSTHFALTGDVSVGYQVLQGVPTLSFGVVQLVDVTGSTETLRSTRNLPSTTSGDIYFACSYFDHEGEFEFRILAETGGPVLAVSNTVYVYWPDVKIAPPPDHVEALTSAVAVTIFTNENLCRDMSHNRYETTVALIYHGGQRTVLTSNELPTPAPTDGILSDELPTGVLGSEDQVQFYCNAIDRAGFYTFEYQSTFNRSVIARSDFLQVIWSDEYKVYSPQDNIFPCSFDNGLEINYEYPTCRGENDKIRVFGQKLAFSRQPAPGTLEYITEEGAYDIKSVYFFCENFSKDYKGYCFKYVSVARSGAVDDHFMTCIPTNGTGPPLNGAWSTWSSWGDCTVTCGEGVRYRFRLCNNPTPVNGGAPCLGETVESEACPYQPCPTDRPVTDANPDRGINVIPGCNCGCVLREVNGTISSSPGSCTTGFGAWTVLVADDLRIQLNFRSFDLYLHDEWLRVRDGADQGARVLAYHTGSKVPAPIESSKNKLYLEYKVTEKETAQMRGFSAVYSTFVNTQYITPAAPIPAVDEVDKGDDGSAVSLGSVTSFVLISAVFFCIFVIVLSVICTGYAGWKRKKYIRTEGREDSGLTAGCRSSASGHSLEPSARCLAHSGSSGSELSNCLNNKRGCPDGRFVDRSNLYMVKDETGLTYLPESNLSSPSHAEDGAKPLVTIPEVPHSPYADQDNPDVEEDLTKYEVTLPYHLGPGSVSELSGRHTARTDMNATDLAMKNLDKRGSSRGSHSVRGSQTSVFGSQGGANGISSRSQRSGSGSISRFENSDSSISRRHRGVLLSPLSPQDTDLRVLEGSEDPNYGHSSGARRKRKPSPSGSHHSHSSHSHRSSHKSHNSHHSGHNSHQGSHRSHHSHRSRDSTDHNKSDSGRRRKHNNTIHPEMGQRPTVVGESPTTQGPRKLPSPSRMAFHDQQKHLDRPSPVAEHPSSEMGEQSRHRSKKRHHSKPPAPSSYTNEVFDIGYSTNLGPRAPIWPGKSPSTECASDTNSRGSHNSSIQNKIETTADIEISPPCDEKPKKREKHKKSRHKRDSKSGKLSSGGSAEDDPKTASRLANHSNGYLEQDKKDAQSESNHSDPSVSSPLHFAYLNNKQRRDYMKSVFISDESLARTHSGQDSANTSKTTTPHMVHRKLPDTPPLSGLSSPTKSLTCVPIYSDGISISGKDPFEFDDFVPNLPGAFSDNQKQLPSRMSPVKKLEKPEKCENEKGEVVKNGTEKEVNRPELNVINGTNGSNGTIGSSGSNGSNGMKSLTSRRTRPPRGPLSAASLV